MFVGLGVGAYATGIFHLFTHAFFKALLFLGAGSAIHALHGEQDLRKMGGLWRVAPYTFVMMLIGTLALTGFPYTAGYFSKDAIIEAAYASHGDVARYAFSALVFAAFLTSFYSWRLMFMAFFGKPRADHHTMEHAHESPPVMLVPLILLAIGALVAGYLFAPYFLGDHYAAFWKQALYTNADNHVLHEMHNVPQMIALSPTIAMVAGFLIALISYVLLPGIPAWTVRTFKPIHAFLYNKWYFDELYDWIFVRPLKWLARALWKGGDGAIIDGLGADNAAARVLDITRQAVRIQSGYVYHYAFVMLIGVAVLVSYFAYTLSRGGYLG